MIRSSRALGALALSISIGNALISCQPVFHREVSGRVLSIAGAATQTQSRSNARLTNESLIATREKISTSNGSRVDLMLLPGLLAELLEDTEVEVTELHLAKDGNETIHPMRSREARLRLIRGTLFVSVGQTQTRSRVFVEMPDGVLSAGSSSTFKVEMKGHKMRVTCVRGKKENGQRLPRSTA